MRPLHSIFLFVVLLFSAAVSCGGGSRGGGGACPEGCTDCQGSVCKNCVPGQNTCAGGAVVACNPNGTFGTTVRTCDITRQEMCSQGTCTTPCDAAAQSHSYIGCDYWPTTTLTPSLNSEFDFAVAVALPPMAGDVVMGGASATVTVSRGDQLIETRRVDPGSVEIIKLPWVNELSQNASQTSIGTEQPSLVPQGAYHLISDLPVTVYQFSPLQFERPQSPTCRDQQPIDAMCHSFTNDASLLLPTTALRTEYMVVSRGTQVLKRKSLLTGEARTTSSSGFFTIVATEDNTTVNITYSAYTDGAGVIAGAGPGDKDTFNLQKGDVLQILSKHAEGPCIAQDMDADFSTETSYCDLGPTYDLTGTQVSADRPIALFGGHGCTFVPYNRWACDHLEEQIPPVDTWGKKIVVVATEPQQPMEPNMWRILSASPNNQITFDPPEVHDPVTLGLGEYIEFPATDGFLVEGTGRTAVAQLMVGQNYFQRSSSAGVGDPSMGMGVPIEQHRDSYDFLTPETYTKSYVNIVAPVLARLILDGNTLSDPLTPIGTTGYGYLRKELMPGSHHITSDAKFGITVSGTASYTSYLYAGGLDLNEVPLQ